MEIDKNKKAKNWKCFIMISLNVIIAIMIMCLIFYDRISPSQSEHDIIIALVAVLGTICGGFTMYYTGHNYFKHKYGAIKNPQEKQEKNKEA